jgi:hypothetical protein
VDHRLSQVETLFGELEYIEARLKALGVVDEETDNAQALQSPGSFS